MRPLRRTTLLLLAAVTLTAPSCLNSDESLNIEGAGATFPAPLYKRWMLEYYRRHPTVRVNYQAVGSGAGIRQFLAGNLLDFGASDAAMTPQEIAAVPENHGVVLLPMTAGSIALAYNLPNGPAELKLTRSALLGIAHGDIDNWNDPALVDANPGSSLPDLPISWIRRAEGSGTTYAFTNHLHAVDPDRWPVSLRGKTVDWPKGVGAKGNNGVAALIQQTPGAIGYIESGYAELTGLPTAAVQNKAGRFVQPTAASSLAALQNATIPDDLIIWVTDPEGPDAYPIVTYTWIIAYRRYRDPRRLDALKAVLRYGATEGQQYSADLGYVPLPQNVAAKVLAKLDSMTASDDGR